MEKTVWVDQDECISCGLCVSNVPDVFRFADNGKAEVCYSAGVQEKTIQQEAIYACPVSCIHWQEYTRGKLHGQAIGTIYYEN